MEIIEERLDKLLLQLGLAASRAEAEKIIQETGVTVNGKLIRKIGKKFPLNSNIKLTSAENSFSSKSAFKLLKAIEVFKLDFRSKTILDVYSNNGSFAEVALKEKAKKIYHIEGIKNTLNSSLKAAEEIIYLDVSDVRELNANLISELIDFCLIEAEEISLKFIFPFVHLFLKPHAQVLAVLKPQNELSRKDLTKNGLVKRKAEYPNVIDQVITEAKNANLNYILHIESPILGENANFEFLILFEKL